MSREINCLSKFIGDWQTRSSRVPSTIELNQHWQRTLFVCVDLCFFFFIYSARFILLSNAFAYFRIFEFEILLALQLTKWKKVKKKKKFNWEKSTSDTAFGIIDAVTCNESNFIRAQRNLPNNQSIQMKWITLKKINSHMTYDLQDILFHESFVIRLSRS